MITVASGENGVEVRLVSLRIDRDNLERLKNHLSDEELQRGKRLIDEERRNQFYAGRGILRENLAGYLGEQPDRLVLSEGKYGKLHLPGPDALRFNLSHAGDYLLMAFSPDREIGVDMEVVRHDLPYRAMAERYFSQRERDELFSLPHTEQLGAFYRCWTRKEAYLKGTGSGFSQPSTAFDVSLLPDHPPALLAHRISPEEVGRWSIKDIAVPAGYCAALAVEKMLVSHGDTEVTEKETNRISVL